MYFRMYNLSRHIFFYRNEITRRKTKSLFRGCTYVNVLASDRRKLVVGVTGTRMGHTVHRGVMFLGTGCHTKRSSTMLMAIPATLRLKICRAARSTKRRRKIPRQSRKSFYTDTSLSLSLFYTLPFTLVLENQESQGRKKEKRKEENLVRGESSPIDIFERMGRKLGR